MSFFFFWSNGKGAQEDKFHMKVQRLCIVCICFSLSTSDDHFKMVDEHDHYQPVNSHRNIVNRREGIPPNRARPSQQEEPPTGASRGRDVTSSGPNPTIPLSPAVGYCVVEQTMGPPPPHARKKDIKR